MMDEKSVGARISELRIAKKMTQAQLAETLSISDKTVSKWEVGGGYPDITLLPSLADVFECSIDYLLLGKCKTQQKLLYGNSHNTYSYGKLVKEGLVSEINNTYLKKGWKIVNTKLATAENDTDVLLVVLEK